MGFVLFIQPFFGEKVNQVTVEVKSPAGAVECRVQGEWNSHYEFTYSNVSGNTNSIFIRKIVSASGLP